ncbi:MAG: hypothetical protein NZL93_02775, partial [Chthoniobacterales bacterium]|nr:hypothetical protein [Chthoniobacterales bacterium]
ITHFPEIKNYIYVEILAYVIFDENPISHHKTPQPHSQASPPQLYTSTKQTSQPRSNPTP